MLGGTLPWQHIDLYERLKMFPTYYPRNQSGLHVMAFLR
jgi:hypothetical protein